MMLRGFRSSLAVLVLLLLSTTSALGQTAINQSKANAGLGGCDAAGFPVTICKSGSYKLTSNPTVPDASTTAIEITVGDVTLDLNGFAILGPTVCSGSPTTCSPIAPGIGLHTTGQVNNVTVTGGTVHGMGTAGIFLVGLSNTVEKVRARSNGGVGIFVGGIVAGSVAVSNGGQGILVQNGVAVGNTAVANGHDGILATGASTVTGNTTTNNGGNGISVQGASTVIGNTARSNVGFGLALVPNAGYGQNVIVDNNGSNANPQVSGGIQIGASVCGTDTICP